MVQGGRIDDVVVIVTLYLASDASQAERGDS